jgi:hypothetical protein
MGLYGIIRCIVEQQHRWDYGGILRNITSALGWLNLENSSILDNNRLELLDLFHTLFKTVFPLFDLIRRWCRPGCDTFFRCWSLCWD